MIDEKYRDFLVVRPLPEDVELDKFRMPIIKKIEIVGVKTKKIRVTNFNNLNSVLDKNITILDTFNYDAVLKRLWNDPLKYVAKLASFFQLQDIFHDLFDVEVEKTERDQPHGWSLSN